MGFLLKFVRNTPGTAGGPGGRDRTLAVQFFRKKIKITKKNILLHISSSYAKILGETNFHAQEFPGSGSKVEDGEEKKERKKTEQW